MRKLKNFAMYIIWTYVFAQAIRGWYQMFWNVFDYIQERRRKLNSPNHP